MFRHLFVILPERVQQLGSKCTKNLANANQSYDFFIFPPLPSPPFPVISSVEEQSCVAIRANAALYGFPWPVGNPYKRAVTQPVGGSAIPTCGWRLQLALCLSNEDEHLIQVCLSIYYTLRVASKGKAARSGVY